MLSDPKIDYTAESVNHPIKDDHVEDGDALSPGGPVIDGETNRKLLRKIDICLMPVMCFTYALQYYDKALLSQAAIFGLREDLGLKDGLRYSWVSLVFYFGYMAGCYPVRYHMVGCFEVQT